MSVYLVSYDLGCVVKNIGNMKSNAFFSEFMRWDWISRYNSIPGVMRVGKIYGRKHFIEVSGYFAIGVSVIKFESPGIH